MFIVITFASLIVTILLFMRRIISRIYVVPIVFSRMYLSFTLLWLAGIFIVTRPISLKKEYVKSNRFFRAYSDFILLSLRQFFRIKVHVSGTEKLPTEKFLLVGNHRSSFDPIITMNVLKEYNLAFVAKKFIMKVPIIRRLMHRCFCLPLDRNDLRKQSKTIKKASEIIISQEASMGIYPEGTRNWSDTLLPFMHGAFKIAKKADCPIVVAVIRNTDHIVKNFPFRKTDVYLDFVEVMDRTFVETHNTTEISDMAHSLISEKLSRTA